MTAKNMVAALALIVVASSAAAEKAMCLGMIPPAPADRRPGSAIMTEVTSMTLVDREARLYSEITSGNVPSFLRYLKSVSVETTVPGEKHTATFYVTPDYLAVGTDEDYVRTPMTPILAQKICDRFQCVLPTRKMVNDIYASAEVKVAPSPIPPTPAMSTVPLFVQHNQVVAQQLKDAGAKPGQLVGGIKKDIVITPRLATKEGPPRVAIYGWHKLDGVAIQPLSLVHQATYADYSHGVRLVHGTMVFDGETTNVREFLKNNAWWVNALSDEGPIASPGYPTVMPPMPAPKARDGATSNAR